MTISVQVIGPDDNHVASMMNALPVKPSHLSVRATIGGVAEAAALVRDNPPDLLLVGANRPSEHELHLLEQSLLGSPATAALLLAEDRSSDFLIRAMRAGIREVVPWPSAEGELLAAVGRQLGRLDAQRGESPQARVVSFVSAKGGSGATFLAANVAAELASREARTLLVDLNAPFGDAALHLTGERPLSGVADLTRQVSRIDATLIEAIAMHPAASLSLLAAPDAIERHASVSVDAITKIIDLAAPLFRFIILDLGRSCDPVSMRGLELTDEVVLVTQQSLPYMHAAQKSLELLGGQGIGPERVKVLINRYQRDGDLSPGQAESLLGVESSFRIPNSYRAVGRAINHGEPIRTAAPRDPVCRAVNEFVDTLYGSGGGGRSSGNPLRFWH